MSALAILDLVSDDIDETESEEKAEEKPEPKREDIDADLLDLVFHEYKAAKSPRDGVEAMRVLLDLMK
jgi:hypothetical protein